MTSTHSLDRKRLGHMAGLALLGTIMIGMLSAFTIGAGININLVGDTLSVSEAMFEAETRLRGIAYIGLALAVIESAILIAFFKLSQRVGSVLALLALITGLFAVSLTIMGSVYAMNAAEIATQSAFDSLADVNTQQGWIALQVTSIYTSFHLALVLGSLSKAVFFGLFWKGDGLPKLIAGWGVFAFTFVALAIVLRDFIPVLGHDLVTSAFMLSNLIALIASGLYFALKGGRP